jgi:hypothetical protein
MTETKGQRRSVEDVLRDVRSLMPVSMKLGSGGAVGRLAGTVEHLERPISLVLATREDLPIGSRHHLLLLTDRAVLLTSLRAGPVERISFKDVDSFSSRNSNPLSYALDFVTLGLSKSMSCHYIFRLKSGARVPLANVRPERRGFMVARRIQWYLARAALPDSERLQAATQAASQFTGGLMRRARAAAQARGLDKVGHPPAAARGQEPNDGGGDEVSREDIVAHLAALHEMGLLSEDELHAKLSELDVVGDEQQLE